MRLLLYLFVVSSIVGCSLSDNSPVVIGKDTLQNKTIIQLEMRGGGATGKDVIWVKKVSNSEENYIGKIEWYLNGFDSKISQVNDSLITVRLTDTATVWKGKFRDFVINLNNKVQFNDGSMYADSTY
jgi:hypothetical protein